MMVSRFASWYTKTAKLLRPVLRIVASIHYPSPFSEGNAVVKQIEVASYVSTVFAGVFILAAHNLFATSSHTLWVLMATFLATGSAISALGRLRDRWAPEYMALPLVIVALFVFLILNFEGLDWPPAATPPWFLILANTSLLLTLIFLFARRWFWVKEIHRVVSKAAKEQGDARNT